MNRNNIDYLIVGAGLAGCILAHQLLKAGKKIIVINDSERQCSSLVAAGLYNPITGKNFQKTWRAEDIFPYIEKFYKEIEVLTDCKFLHPSPIVVPINTVEEQNILYGKSALNEDHRIAITVFPANPDLPTDNPLGTFQTSHSGYLHVEKFIDASSKYFRKNDSLIIDDFNYSEVEIAENTVRWKDISTTKIVFCEGFHALQNPYFSWLPFTPNKGELMTVKIHNWRTENIFRKKVFLIPLGEGVYKCGSTYKREHLKQGITEEASKELSGHLEDLIKTEYLVDGQYWGIRPATRDRKPIIGLHPHHKQLAIFNGLGSKGVSLAPYFASQLVQFFEGTTALDKEVNIERFYSWHANHI